MNISRRSYIILPLIYFLLILYLLFNTGIFSDDFAILARLKDKSFEDILIPKGNFYFIETPVEYFTHYIWYLFFRIDNLIVINIFKVLYTYLSFYIISRFFQIFLNKQNAFLASFLFIFFPSHDSTTYWFLLYYLTLSFAFFLFAFYSAYNNKLILAFLLALAGSFISYGSPPIAIALFSFFLLNKQLKKGLVLLIPNILYSIYYIFITQVLSVGTDKIAMNSGLKGTSIYSLIKQFILQILTFLDAMIGPSSWLKILYSFSQLSLISGAIGILVAIIIYKKYQGNKEKYNIKLVLSLSVLALLSLVMFAITGYYPQLAFNLGNRVTIFSSLLLAYLIVLIPLSHKLKTLILILMIFSVLGISDHWKKWYAHQQTVIANIKNNQDLKNYKGEKTIYVSGNQYSKFGPLSHIEFLSQGWVVRSIFKLSLEKEMSAESLNKRYQYSEGFLIGAKYNLKKKVNGYINVYDSESDILFKVDVEKINGFISSLPQENRHWVQILDIKFMKDIAVRLMPRLKYTL